MTRELEPVDRWWHLRHSSGEYSPLFNNLGRDLMLGGFGLAFTGMAFGNYGWVPGSGLIAAVLGLPMWFFAGSPL